MTLGIGQSWSRSLGQSTVIGLEVVDRVSPKVTSRVLIVELQGRANLFRQDALIPLTASV